MLKIIFLLSIAITTALTAMQFSGYQVLDLVIIMIIIDFISLGASIELERKKSDKETKGFITTKLEGIENICKDIFSHITSPNPGFEAKLEKQKNDMSYILDKIAKKSLELEEKLNVFGRVLTSDTKEKIEVSEETVEEEKPAESFNVGEIMYVEEEGQE
jgi:hypothetical protein